MFSIEHLIIDPSLITVYITYSCLVDLTGVTLAVEDSNSKPVDVVAFAFVDIQESVEDRMVTADSLATASQVRQQHDSSLGFKLVVARLDLL